MPCPPPGHLPDPGIKPGSPELQADSLPSEPPRRGKYFQLSLSLGSKWKDVSCRVSATILREVRQASGCLHRGVGFYMENGLFFKVAHLNNLECLGWLQSSWLQGSGLRLTPLSPKPPPTLDCSHNPLFSSHTRILMLTLSAGWKHHTAKILSPTAVLILEKRHDYFDM